MSVPSSESEPPYPEQLPDLPDEVLLIIFQNLRKADLARVRLTCRRWNEVVGINCSLMDKFELFIKDCNLNECLRENLELSSTNSRYTRATLEGVDIDVLNPLWQRLGDNLRELTLQSCFISDDLLVQLIMLSPKLKCLAFIGLDFEEFHLSDVINGFKLEQLETLVLRSMIIPDECFDLFKQTCPRVRVLRMSQSFVDKNDDNLIQFVEAVQDTLEELNMSNSIVTPKLLRRLAAIERLKLKKITLSGSRLEGRDIVLLSQVQPTIVSLGINEVEVVDEDLIEISQNLPNLKRVELTTYVVNELYNSFLSKMQNLVYLRITDAHFSVNIGAYTNPLLRDLHIYNVKFPAGTLRKLLENCPNIRSMTMNNCVYEDESEPDEMFFYLEWLERWNRQCSLDEDCDCTLALVHLYQWCPKLNHLTVNDCRNLTNSMMETACQAFGLKLKYLNLDGCKLISDLTANHILNYCKRLETLSLLNCRRVSDEAKKQLKCMKSLDSIYLDEPCRVS